MPQSIQEEVDRNYAAFEVKLPYLLPTYKGKFALMRHAEIVQFFDTARDAYLAGRLLFADDSCFSLQEVVDPPQSLRWIWGRNIFQSTD